MSLFPSLTSNRKAPKPYEVSLYDTRATLDPHTYTPEMANVLAPWTADTGLLTKTVADRAAKLDANSGIYDTLDKQAQDDLALGGGLNADEIRAATQGARAAYSARGMVNAPQGILAEVMARAGASNARRRERQAFATTVEGLRANRQQQTGGLLTSLAGISTLGNTLGEGVRQFELERDDALRQKDKEAAVNLKIGKDQASAGRTSGIAQGLGSVVGGILSHI